MHGLSHDYVVSQTIPGSLGLPSGFGAGIVSDNLKECTTIVRKFNSILDIGSLDVCGSMRTYNFCGKLSFWLSMVSDTGHYYGIDLIAGRGVDQVMDAHDIKFEDNTFELVLCLSVLEHDSNCSKTIAEGYRVLAPGGIFLIDCPNETMPAHMDDAPIELPYNFITEKRIRKWLDKEIIGAGGKYILTLTSLGFCVRVEKPERKKQ